MIFVVCCGIVVILYAFPPIDLLEKYEDQAKKGEEMTVLSGGSIIKESEADISISQHIFTGNDSQIKDLWALDDHGIAQAIWFYDTFWDYFDTKDKAPSMFSCEDVDGERLKQPMKWKCRWHEIKYKPFSFIFMTKTPLLFIENWKIYIKDQTWREYEKYEIAQYNIGKNLNFNDVIEKNEVWLDKKYCLKEHYFWNTFKNWNISWIAGLGEKLNKLYNKAKLKIYDIHEIVDGDCSNNTPGIVLYEEWSQKFYSVIGNNPGTPVLYYDGIYSTPFSIDIE